MKIGFIKLQRELFGTWIHKDDRYFKAFCDILFNLNWEDKEAYILGRKMTCKAGESLLSLDSWANVFNSNKTKKSKSWDKSQVRRFFNKLKEDNRLIIKSEGSTTRLSLPKRHDFATITDTDLQRKTTQLNDGVSSNYAKETNAKRTQNDTDLQRLPTPTKEERKKKEDNKKKKETKAKVNIWDSVEFPQGFTPEVKKAFLDFMEHKRARRESYKTKKSIETLVKKWSKAIEEHGVQNLIISIEETFSNNWSGVFPKNHIQKNKENGNSSSSFKGNSNKSTATSKRKRFAERRRSVDTTNEASDDDSFGVQEF